MIALYPQPTSVSAIRSPEDARCCEGCEERILAAKRELSASTTAVGRRFGARAATLAASRWIERAESATAPQVDGYPNWRRITITVAYQLAANQLLLHGVLVSKGERC
ncbi:hypothetical protein [Granulicella mallensis]|uniref:Uncharacterized protein n=1 Tax=Granulicella mallensis TaxID=940614 RepID=A0A7W7ZQU4_9BACT|nr:hypothetical protein [Granulicella mallensis]MBB5064403.1 hypothetical protein [Granulicella mallensis]